MSIKNKLFKKTKLNKNKKGGNQYQTLLPRYNKKMNFKIDDVVMNIDSKKLYIIKDFVKENNKIVSFKLCDKPNNTQNNIMCNSSFLEFPINDLGLSFVIYSTENIQKQRMSIFNNRQSSVSNIPNENIATEKEQIDGFTVKSTTKDGKIIRLKITKNKEGNNNQSDQTPKIINIDECYVYKQPHGPDEIIKLSRIVKKDNNYTIQYQNPAGTSIEYKTNLKNFISKIKISNEKNEDKFKKLNNSHNNYIAYKEVCLKKESKPEYSTEIKYNVNDVIISLESGNKYKITDFKKNKSDKVIKFTMCRILNENVCKQYRQQISKKKDGTNYETKNIDEIPIDFLGTIYVKKVTPL
jgi:hypothetical protein